MISIPAVFPFSRLKLQEGEILQWVGYNPTFHRLLIYGLAIADVAFYACSSTRMLARWKRYAVADISDVEISSEASAPAIRFRVEGKKRAICASFDSDLEEARFDRDVFTRAAEHLKAKLAQSEAPVFLG